MANQISIRLPNMVNDCRTQIHNNRDWDLPVHRLQEFISQKEEELRDAKQLAKNR